MERVNHNLPRSIFILGIAALISFVCVIMSLVIIISKIGEITKVVGQKQQLTADVAQLDRNLNEYRSQTDSLAAIKAAYPKSFQEVAYVVSLYESNALTHKVKIVLDVEPETKIVTGTFPYIKVTAAVEGTYQNLAAFISSLSGLPYHIEYESLLLQKASPIKSTITTRVYVQPQ